MNTDELFKDFEKINYQQQIDLSYANMQLMQKYLKQLRKVSNLSSEQLGKHIGVSGQTILNLEKNKIIIKEKIVKSIYTVFLEIAVTNMENNNFLLFNLLIALFFYKQPLLFNTINHQKSKEAQSFIESNIFNDTSILQNKIIFHLEKYNQVLSFDPNATPFINDYQSFKELFNISFSSDWLLLEGESMIEALTSNLRNLRIIAGLSVDEIREKFNLEKSSYAHYELGTSSLDVAQSNILIELFYSLNNDKKEIISNIFNLIFSKNYIHFKNKINSELNKIAQIFQTELNIEILNTAIKQMLSINCIKVFNNEMPLSLNEVLLLPYKERDFYFDCLIDSCISVSKMNDFCLDRNIVSADFLAKIDPDIILSNENNYIHIQINSSSFTIKKICLNSFIEKLEILLDALINKKEKKILMDIEEGELQLEIICMNNFPEQIISTFIKKGNFFTNLDFPSNKYNLIKLINVLKTNI